MVKKARPLLWWPYVKSLLRQLLRPAAPEIEAASGDPVTFHQRRWINTLMAAG